MAGWIPAGLGLFFAVATAQAPSGPPNPRDVLALPNITEVRIAPDGSEVVYAVRARDLGANRTTQTFWRAGADGETVDSLPIDSRASNVRWRPDGLRLTYLAPDKHGNVQIWEYAGARELRQLTRHSWSILSYEWSPDSQRLAFTSSRVSNDGEGRREGGVVIDRLHFWMAGLLSEDGLDEHSVHYGRPATRNELWVHDARTRHGRLVSKALSVSAFAWSPNGRLLAFTARAGPGRLPPEWARHDLLLYTLDGDRIDTLEVGTGGDYLGTTIIYDDPFWSPDGDRIGYFRRDWRDRWESSPQLGIFSLGERRTIFFVTDAELETYQAQAFWLHPDTVLLENTYRAGRRLFAVAISDGSVRPIVDSEDWFDQHSFSKDGRVVAFIRERTDMPAEVFISDRAMQATRQVTNLHGLPGAGLGASVERLTWTAQDGVKIEGWLYLPAGDPPFPTMVFVHGGPTWVYPNRYQPYVSYWPYAFELFAARGVAVLVPNYRGTGSYGKSFRRMSALDAEPVDDILAGLDTLIGREIADPARLGIAGHSHGCSLGSLIAVRHRRFAAAACAEGTANWATQYAVNSGWTNSEIVDHYWGAGRSPYEAPEEYRRLSAIYGFEGLRTPFLFEAGEQAWPLSAVEFAMAALRSGVPHELVIYRDTGHNVTEPRVMLEVMQRNLEWFEFWLFGREYDSESKRGQYTRWRRLRTNARRGTG